jgi:hypothetical protein
MDSLHAVQRQPTDIKARVRLSFSSLPCLQYVHAFKTYILHIIF